MLTMAPELRPYSALNVELSTLNSCTVLIDGWNVIWFCSHVVQVDAVDHEVHGVFAVAGGIERERALAAQRRRQEAVLRRRHRTGREQTEVDEMAAVQRNVLDGALVDHLADRDGRGVDQRHRRR